MKYILNNDIKFFLKKQTRMLIFYIFVIIFFILSQKIANAPMDKNLFNLVLSLDLKLNADNFDIWDLTFFILNYGIFIYIALNLYLNDLKKGLDNVFLRMNKENWIIYKLISNLLITFVVNAVIFGLLLLFAFSDVSVMLLFLKRMIYITILQNILYIMLVFFKNYKYIISLFLLIILLFINQMQFSVVNMSLVNLLINLVIVTIFIINTYKYISTKALEKF